MTSDRRNPQRQPTSAGPQQAVSEGENIATVQVNLRWLWSDSRLEGLAAKLVAQQQGLQAMPGAGNRPGFACRHSRRAGSRSADRAGAALPGHSAHRGLTAGRIKRRRIR